MVTRWTSCRCCAPPHLSVHGALAATLHKILVNEAIGAALVAVRQDCRRGGLGADSGICTQGGSTHVMPMGRVAP